MNKGRKEGKERKERGGEERGRCAFSTGRENADTYGVREAISSIGQNANASPVASSCTYWQYHMYVVHDQILYIYIHVYM